MAAVAQGQNYFDMSNQKCQGGPAQPAIDPTTGLKMPQGAGAIVMPGQQPVKGAQKNIGSDLAKQAFSQASQPQQQQVAPPQPQQVAQVQAGIDTQKQIQANAYASAVAACRNGSQAYIKTDEESLKAAFGKMADRIKTRRFKFSKTFTMAQAAVSGVTVSCTPENKHIFQIKDPEGGVGRVGVPETGILLGARVLTAFSDCRAQVGVKMSGARGNTYTPAGGRYVLVLDSGERLQYDAPGMVIHKITELVDVHRLHRYGHIKDINEIKKGIFPVTGLNISFVSVGNPVIHILENNKDLLHIPADAFVPFENQFHIIENQVIDAVLQELDRSFFKNMPFTDFARFKLTLERGDGRKWNDPAGVESYSSGASGDAGTYFLNKPNQFYAWIELDYVLTNVTRPASDAVAPSTEITVTVASAAKELTTGY